MMNPLRWLAADWKARRDLKALVRARGTIWGDLWGRGLEHLAIQGDVADPMTQVGAVHTAISILAQSLASVPWSLYQGEDRVETHPFYDLMAGSGSESLSGTQLLEGSVSWREMQGRSYWLLNGIAGPASARRPTVIDLLEANRVTGVVDEGDLIAWEYQTRKGRTIRFDTREVVRFSYFDHRDSFGGLAPLEAARLGYRLNWRSSEFQNRFFTNGGFPPFYVKLPEAATMKPEDQERIRTDFREKYLGLRNAWVPPILSRGATLESVGINQRDAEWLATQKATTWDILNIFQVPPEIAGYTEDANRSVSVEAKRKFWAGRIRSMGEHFASVIQRRVIDVFWPGLTFRFDWGAKFSEVMPEETRAAIESAGKLWAIGVPASEAFRVLGINVDVEGKPWLDDGFLPFGVMKASEINEEPREEQQDDDAADDQEDRRVRRLVTGLKDSSWPSPGTKLRDTLWRTYTARTDRAERRLRTDYGRFLSWLFDTAMTNLLGSGATQGRFANIDAVVRDETKRRIVPDDREVERKAKEATAQAQTFAARTGWDSVVNEIGVDDPFDITDPNVLRLLAQRSVQIAGAGVNAATRLRATLAEGVAAGETVDDLADRIRAKHREEYAGQARTVARTETMAAFSGARHEAMESHGISRHEWLSARDEVVRESHQIDGQTRAMGEPFTNGLLYPLDPSGSPGETVNCRCVALAVVS